MIIDRAAFHASSDTSCPELSESGRFVHKLSTNCFVDISLIKIKLAIFGKNDIKYLHNFMKYWGTSLQYRHFTSCEMS